jgi:integrase
MPKKGLPSYRLHKRSGQAVVTLNSKDFYLGKYKSKASRERYEEIIGEYIANGKKLPPTQQRAGISFRELAVYFLEWAEKYYIKDGESTESCSFCQKAITLFVKHYGEESTDNFGPLSLVFLQDEWVEQGLGRKTVNKNVRVIRQAFKYGKKFGWVTADTYLALQDVDSLKKGHTKAPEYRKIKPVPLEIVEKTLPFMPPVVDDMARVQLLCAMRPQDVCNMRAIDIDRSGEVWRYEPFTHKNEDKDKERIIAIGPKAQAILAAYLFEKEETPEAFLFSPKDSVLLQKLEKRRKRKSLGKNGQVQPSQRDRSRPNAAKPGDQYTTNSYNRAVTRACKLAGVPKWTVNQLRHTMGTTVRKGTGGTASKPPKKTGATKNRKNTGTTSKEEPLSGPVVTESTPEATNDNPPLDPKAKTTKRDFIIHPVFRDLLLALTDIEYAELEKSILRDRKCRDKFVVAIIIVDGKEIKNSP